MGDDLQSSAESPGSILAAHIDGHRAEILDAYERRLKALGSGLVGDPVSRAQAFANADQILTDVVVSLRSDVAQLDEGYKLLAVDIGETRATQRMHPRQSLQAAVVFFEVVLANLDERLGDSLEWRHEFALAALVLNRSIGMRIREAATSYTGHLLDRVHDAQIEERHRIARELHDRVGGGLSVAQRQLELHDVYRDSESIKAARRVEIALNAIRESMHSLRAVMSDLRLHERLTSLEKELVTYLDSAPTQDVSVSLRVSGDETWAPEPVRDETYWILREAVRNALTHGSPSFIVISVNIAPHELNASVADDGIGFDPERGHGSGRGGLVSMRERAELLGGTMSLSSEPGRGTHLEVFIPLPGHRDEPAF